MKYIEAKLDIIAFEAEDVITTSLTNGGEGNGDEGDFGDLFG